MLTVEEAIKQRRTIRHFKSDPIPKDMVIQMLEAARLAPSGGNRQPWRFIVVTDAEEKEKLRSLCLNQAFIEEAPVVFVACADLSAYSKESVQMRLKEFADAGVDMNREMSGSFADPVFRQKYFDTIPEPTVAERASSIMAYIATEHLILMATALGLGSCWIGAITDREKVKNILGIPANVALVALVAVGYAEYWPPARPRLAMEQILLRPLPNIK